MENNVEFETLEILTYEDVIQKPSWQEAVGRINELSNVDLFNLGSASEIDWKYIENIMVTNAQIENLAADKITGQIVDAQIANIGWAKIDDILVENAHIADATIEHGKIASLDAGDITTGTLHADRIASGSIHDTKLGTTVISGGKIITGLLTANNITTGTLTGITIQTSTTGKRLRMQGSPANEYQFLDGATKVGHLKIDDDGSSGYFAQIYIDHLGAALEVGSTVGVAETTYFSAPFFSSFGRAAVGEVIMIGNDVKVGLEWSGGDTAYWSFNLGTSLARIASNVEPNNDYDLGSASYEWRDLRMSRDIKSIRNLKFTPGTVAASEEGNFYFDSGTKKFRYYDGTQWKSVATE